MAPSRYFRGPSEAVPAERAVLIASDLSARCDRALERAFLLGQEMGWPLMLAHVIDQSEAADEHRLAQLHHILRRDLGPRADQLRVRITAGSVPTMLSTIASEEDSPLIVTGVARYNSLTDHVLGTAVDFLVRTSPVPVLVVRRRAIDPYRRLLALTDFSICSQTALEAADDFFPAASIDLLHVVPAIAGPEARAEADERMQDFIADLEESLRDRVTARVEQGDLGQIVEASYLAGDFDLLVLGTHGRGALARAALGSHASAILAGAIFDTLVVRD